MNAMSMVERKISQDGLGNRIKDLPHAPGCYLFLDGFGRIIYIGKAKDIQKRVSTYFLRDADSKTEYLVKNISGIDFFVTDTEVEALVLENNLVKKHQPKFNIDLKDAKSFAYLALTSEAFPRLVLARGRPEGSHEYFGPFTSAEDRDHILMAVRKTFKIRTCRRLPKKACLRYHIGICSAPCMGKITKEQYAETVAQAKEVLSGKSKELKARLLDEMKNASEATDYERALDLKKKTDALDWLSERQKMQRKKRYDEAIINYMIRGNTVYLAIFGTHSGILDEKREYSFPYTPDFLEEFLVQFYSENPVPKELIVPENLGGPLKLFLEQKRESVVRIVKPLRGEKKKLLELVAKNIELAFFSEEKTLEDLKDRLGLDDLPKVIECFDISHLSGTMTVGSMVQFKNAEPNKSEYRRFKIRTVGGIDDVRAISEVVRRRYYRLIKEKRSLPDLIVIDGGRGQLNAAMAQLKKLGLNIPIVSLAKRLEEVYVPGLSGPLQIDKKTAALKLLQRVRDEAHRFAISYNRLLRKKELQKK